MGLGVAIITYNEAQNIRRCLESVQWAEEIVVVDSGSQDNTREICLEYTSSVYTHEWPGYSAQKQRAIDLVKSEWVLSLDADEELSFDLQKELQEELQDSSYQAYKIPRQLVFKGKVLKYAEGGSSKLRLFRAGRACMDGKKVHEGLATEEKVGSLKSPLYHHSFSSLEDTVRKMNTYSSLSAEEKASRGEKGGLLKALSHGFMTFMRVYFLKKAMLDGALGFVFSFALAEGSYYRYVKLTFDHKTHVHSSCRRKFSGKSSSQKSSK